MTWSALSWKENASLDPITLNNYCTSQSLICSWAGCSSGLRWHTSMNSGMKLAIGIHFRFFFFLPGYRTGMVSVTLAVDLFQELNKRNMSLLGSVRTSVAFSTINHSILLVCLVGTVLSGPIFQWLLPFLRARTGRGILGPLPDTTALWLSKNFVQKAQLSKCFEPFFLKGLSIMHKNRNTNKKYYPFCTILTANKTLGVGRASKKYPLFAY